MGYFLKKNIHSKVPRYVCFMYKILESYRKNQMVFRSCNIVFFFFFCLPFFNHLTINFINRFLIFFYSTNLTLHYVHLPFIIIFQVQIHVGISTFCDLLNPGIFFRDVRFSAFINYCKLSVRKPTKIQRRRKVCMRSEKVGMEVCVSLSVFVHNPRV